MQLKVENVTDTPKGTAVFALSEVAEKSGAGGEIQAKFNLKAGPVQLHYDVERRHAKAAIPHDVYVLQPIMVPKADYRWIKACTPKDMVSRRVASRATRAERPCRTYFSNSHCIHRQRNDVHINRTHELGGVAERGFEQFARNS